MFEDDLCYETESWQEETPWQDDEGEVEMFQSEWLKWILLLFLSEVNFTHNQTSLELKCQLF